MYNNLTRRVNGLASSKQCHAFRLHALVDRLTGILRLCVCELVAASTSESLDLRPSSARRRERI